MSRLVAFGCSLTYGHGNTDCFTPPNGCGLSPSKFAWPALIASELNIEVVNLANPGSSNKRIWYNIINFNFEQDDIVFIMWSYPERYCVLNEDNDHKNIGNWSNNDLYYNNFYSEYDSSIMNKLFVDHTNQLLRSKKITTYNLVVAKEFNYIFSTFSGTIPHIPVYINSQRNKFNVGLDNKHPNDDCHREIARLIMNNLKIKHSVPKQKQLSKLDRWKRYFKSKKQC